MSLRVLYEAPQHIVAIKPAGMPSELTSDPGGVSLIQRLRRAYPPPLEPKLPHRLDRVTRGVMLVALTKDAIAFYNQEIRLGRWGQFYLARVSWPQNRDVCTLLGPHKAYLKTVRHRAKIVRSGGKPSFLEVLAVHPAPGRAGQQHVLVKLLTGRFHQLRAMLADLGSPLVGDKFYGDEKPRQRKIKDWSDFYLEHIILKYVDLEQGTRRMAHLSNDPDREELAPAMADEVKKLLGKDSD